MVFMKFFRWLYNPDEPDHRKRITPSMHGGRKECCHAEKSLHTNQKTYGQPSIMQYFSKYCHMARDRCWHSMVHDTSARPHELLDLRIRDINFKISSNGIQYAVIHVHGKTTSRTLPLITCIPYVKEWLKRSPIRQ